MTLTVGSLFSGIGGIDLGLERAGMTIKWHSEIDPYACRVLKKHWPTIPNLGNIKDINWSSVEPVDLIAGGYPCQPFSTAGKRQGEKDERHLWPYFLRAIGELRPRYAVMENVRGHLSMGGTTVIGDLAEIGYDCEWQLVSAASVGAPHRRERIIILAYPHDTRDRTPKSGYYSDGPTVEQRRQDISQFEFGRQCETLAYPNGEGWERSVRSQKRKQTFGGFNVQGENCRWGDHWVTEPDVGRVAHGIPSRVDRLRGLGNAVVPQVAEYVGRLIMEAHNG